MNHREALDTLFEGNRRYVEGRSLHPHQAEGRRRETLAGQNPFAAIVGCADSRVPPEVIFDRGIGDLFVVRVAGNIVDDTVTASIEYAVAHLGVSLVVVLGHSSCGAVTAVLGGKAKEGHLPVLAAAIEPAVTVVKDDSADPLTEAIVAHTRLMARRLSGSPPILSHYTETGTTRVVPAFYDLATGVVSFSNH